MSLLTVVRRLGWGVADQAVSSLSNFVLGLFIARTFGAADFGAFTLAYVTYSVILNATRGLATDPLLVRFSHTDRQTWRPAAAASAGVALVVGALAGLACVGVGLMLPDPVGAVFVALGVFLPGLVLQDSWRFAFFAGGRPGHAFANDVAWSLVLGASLLVLHVTETESVVRCTLVLGATATLAGLLGAVQAGTRPAPGQVAAWLREHRDLSVRYLVENVSISGATQIKAGVLGAVASLAAVGHVRSAELLMGPFVVVLMGVSQVAVPEAARVLHRGSSLSRFCFAVGGAQAVGALAWGLFVIVVLPLGVGQLILKELWMPASHLLPAVMLTVVAACFSTAATAGLRAMGVAWRSLRAQLFAAATYAVGGAGGAVVAGAAGTCWGVAAATALAALVWWRHLHAALGDLRQQAPSAVTA